MVAENSDLQVTNEVVSNKKVKEKKTKRDKKIEQEEVKNSRKKSKVWLGISGSIILLFLVFAGSIMLFFGVKLGLAKYYSAENMVAKFEEAIEEKDVNTVKSMLYGEDTTLITDDFQVKALIELCNDDEDTFEDIQSQLRKDISHSDKLKSEKSDELLDEDELMGLMICNENFLFVEYAIMIRNLPLYVNSKGINANAYVNNKVTAINDTNEEEWEVDDFLPGIYDVTLKSKDLLGNDISDTQTVNLVYSNDVESSTFFEEYEIYSVHSNIPEATLFINDENTNILVEDTVGEFGPININDTVVCKYTLDNKEYSSEVATYLDDDTEDGDDSISVDFNDDDYYEIQESLDYKEDIELIEDSAQIYINKYSNFIISSSNAKELTFMELNKYNGEELFIAHNEILARHGQVFYNQPVLQKYFESKDWYRPNSGFNGELTNSIEKNNYNSLRTVEFSTIAQQKCDPIDADYVLPYSDQYEIKSYELSSLSDWELIVARNEIFARYGLEFSTQCLVDYFKSKSWFRINKNIGNDVQITDVERQNVQTILKEEKSRMNYVLNHDLGE